VLAGAVARVEQVPEFRPLVAWVPLAEVVAQADDPLLGARLLLVAAAAPEDAVEAALTDGVEQRLRLERVAGAVGPLPQAAVVDPVLNVLDDQTEAELLDGARRGRRAPPGSCVRCRRAAPGRGSAPARRP
jgi:hypothetical protein